MYLLVFSDTSKSTAQLPSNGCSPNGDNGSSEYMFIQIGGETPISWTAKLHKCPNKGPRTVN